MQITIYAIAKNEEKYLAQFMEAAKEADKIIILDTGSSDNTVALAKQLGCEVHQQIFNPWRFDDARNAALNLIPADCDICFSLDLDETIEPKQGWRQYLEQAWNKDDANNLKLQVKYVHDHFPDGSPRTVFYREHIHGRHNFIWKRPVHEYVSCINGPEKKVVCPGLTIHHWQDGSKPRNNYLTLMKMATEVDPTDRQLSFWYGRQLHWENKTQEAIKELSRYLEISKVDGWNAERAAAMCFLAKCYLQTNQNSEAEIWYHAAVNENYNERESWMELASYYFNKQDYKGSYFAAGNALKVRTRQAHYLVKDQNWKDLPWDIFSVSAWNLNKKQEALEAVKQACLLNPNNIRVKNNYEHIKAHI